MVCACASPCGFSVFKLVDQPVKWLDGLADPILLPPGGRRKRVGRRLSKQPGVRLRDDGTGRIGMDDVHGGFHFATSGSRGSAAGFGTRAPGSGPARVFPGRDGLGWSAV